MFKMIQQSLGAKIILAVALGVFVVLGVVSYVNISYIRNISAEQVQEHSILLGHTVQESLNTLMLLAEQDMIQKTVFNIGNDIK